jgi:hypothetical protein
MPTGTPISLSPSAAATPNVVSAAPISRRTVNAWRPNMAEISTV